VCPNIAGVQVTVPAGFVKDAHGNCVTPAVVGHTDLCLNIDGVQTTVPTGMVRDAHGNCAAAATVHVAGSVQTPSSPHAAPATEVAAATEVQASATKSGGTDQAGQEQPESGVLGATATAPQDSIAETATSGTLPFTGIPLWIVALVGAGLLTAGFALRRGAQH
jgi:cobalamin biosynthesis Mg chelatase CobN